MKGYQVYRIRAKKGYTGTALIATENETMANQIIRAFKEKDIDNKYGAEGWLYVTKDDLESDIIGIREGILFYGITKI